MTIDERMKKMEGQLARLRLFIYCLLACMVLLIACIILSLGVWFISKTLVPEKAWVKSGVKEVRANQFILEDENGKTRAELSMEWDGPGLWLFDEDGNPRALLHINKKGPSLGLFDENGNTRATLYMGRDGPGLGLIDENGKLIHLLKTPS